MLALMAEVDRQQALGVDPAASVGTVDQATKEVLRLAAAAGRDVGYPLLRATAELTEVALRDSLARPSSRAYW